MTDNAGGPGLPPELMNNDPDGFAWGVWHDRTPKLVAQIRDAYPYGPEQRNALDALLDEIASGPMQPLGSDARDHQLWMTWGSGYFGKPWLDTPFLWSESYFYRRVLDATGFFAPGPWHHVDPFAQMKAAELTDSAMELDLATLDDVQRLPVEQQGRAKLMASLWGNQADLGFRIDRPVAPADAEGLTLVADDRDQLWSRLDGTARVAVVADNAGRELLADLVLADHLLQHGHAASITFHVKPYPYYVSDATTSDVVACLGRLTSAPGSASEIGHRLLTRASEGRLSLYTHDFHCAPWSYHRMPADLADQFAFATLTILKGDLNYRRLVGDRAWPPTVPFAEVASYFPGPVAALRTLKSDVVTGLDPATVTSLRQTGQPWRIDGNHALVQAHGRQ
jgi:hypothetical protein